MVHGDPAKPINGISLLSFSFVALMATVGVYGIVALIVRMDDSTVTSGTTTLSTSF